VGTRCADHVTPLYPQKLALTSLTGGGRSVGIVPSRTKATEFSLVLVLFVSIVLLCVLFVCKCVLYYCHRVSTQLQLTNISIIYILFSLCRCVYCLCVNV